MIGAGLAAKVECATLVVPGCDQTIRLSGLATRTRNKVGHF